MWFRIDNDDYVILYAPSGQSGETALSFPSNSMAELKSAQGGVSAEVSQNTVTLNYDLGPPSFTTLSGGGKTVIVITMQKETALNWHAVDIPGGGNFGNYFSIGTNQRYVHFYGLCDATAFNFFVVQCSYRRALSCPVCLYQRQYIGSCTERSFATKRHQLTFS